jgi:hypothetical protein
MMRRFLRFTLALLLAGCGSFSRSDDPVALGNDTYRLSVRAAWGNENSGEKQAKDQAQAHCGKQHRELLVTNQRVSANGGVEIAYRCLMADDPELAIRRE